MIKNTLAAFLFLFSAQLFAETFEQFIVYPGDGVNYQPLESYANMWWQWTYTMPKELSPVRDVTGEHCQQGQKGDVWFLAGGYGTSKIKRTCTIPSGKHIFFPIINMIYYPRQESGISCDDAKASAVVAQTLPDKFTRKLRFNQTIPMSQLCSKQTVNWL